MPLITATGGEAANAPDRDIEIWFQPLHCSTRGYARMPFLKTSRHKSLTATEEPPHGTRQTQVLTDDHHGTHGPATVPRKSRSLTRTFP